jgi:SOS-response transcriptional repressor LexA
VEAFEITAAQRGAPRWEIDSHPASSSGLVKTSLSSRQPAAPVAALKPYDDTSPGIEPNVVRFSEVANSAFKTHLPLVGSLAAGMPFHGLDTGSLDDTRDLDWVAVPTQLAKERRFVVRVAGDSMEPLLKMGDLVVFEYHRSPRKDGQIVIANIPEFGMDGHGIEAIKRIRQDAGNWIFQSENRAYPDIVIPKNVTDHPILGTMIEKI